MAEIYETTPLQMPEKNISCSHIPLTAILAIYPLRELSQNRRFYCGVENLTYLCSVKLGSTLHKTKKNSKT